MISQLPVYRKRCPLATNAGTINNVKVELVWLSGSVMDCHATIRGSIPDGDGVKTELHILRKGQLKGAPSLNDLAVDWT